MPYLFAVKQFVYYFAFSLQSPFCRVSSGKANKTPDPTARAAESYFLPSHRALAVGQLIVPPITFPRQLDEPGGECGRGVLALCFGDVRTVAAAFP